MKITPIKTRVVRAGELTIEQLLDESIDTLPEKSIIVVTSKVISLCAGKVADRADKDALVRQQADWYLDKQKSQYNLSFTITQQTLIPMAGIDESNSDGQLVLWIDDFQAEANRLRAYLSKKYKVQDVGVIITDSTCSPMRRGTVGVYLAHSGFLAIKDYVGEPDLFGRPFSVSMSNIANGLAAGAVVTMGEGTEAMPLAIISEVPFVEFQQRDPNAEELKLLHIDKDEDLFAPFFDAVKWRRGKQ